MFTSFVEVADEANKFFGKVRQSVMLDFAEFLSVIVFKNISSKADILRRDKESVTESNAGNGGNGRILNLTLNLHFNFGNFRI